MEGVEIDQNLTCLAYPDYTQRRVPRCFARACKKIDLKEVELRLRANPQDQGSYVRSVLCVALEILVPAVDTSLYAACEIIYTVIEESDPDGVLLRGRL